MAKKDMNRLNKKIKTAISLPDLGKARNRRLDISERAYNHEIKNFGNGKTYHVRTYGCQGNVRDGEHMAGLLEAMGYTFEEEAEKADVLLLNTCAIREGSEDKIWGYVGKIATVKKQRPDMIFGICGCMPQEEKVIENILSKYHHVDIVFGTHNIDKLPTLVKDASLEKDTIVYVSSDNAEVIENLPSKRTSDVKAFVNVMFGCDNFCSYCIVPYTRGKERSRSSEEILKEVNNLIERGYKEITLVGQNVNDYGLDRKDDVKFPRLLELVAQTNIARVRFTTSNPWNFCDETIDMIAKYENIMPHVHLPMQAGSDEILKRMKRQNTKQDYLDLYNKLKSKVEGISITTDIIVGFPGETRKDFEETLDLVRKCQFDGAFHFVFSPREGTPAALFEATESYDTYLAWLQELMDEVNIMTKDNNIKWEGNTVEVLVEGPSKKNKDVWSGYTPHGKLVNFTGGKDLVGKLVNVKVLSGKSYTLDGEFLDIKSN